MGKPVISVHNAVNTALEDFLPAPKLPFHRHFAVLEQTKFSCFAAHTPGTRVQQAEELDAELFCKVVLATDRDGRNHLLQKERFTARRFKFQATDVELLVIENWRSSLFE